MTEVNYNRKRPYKKLPYSELYQIKNDTGIRQEYRSLAEAEISRRTRFSWPIIITAIATAITALFVAATFFKMCSPKNVILPHTSQIEPMLFPNANKGDKNRNSRKLIEPEKNIIIHTTPTKKDLK